MYYSIKHCYSPILSARYAAISLCWCNDSPASVEVRVLADAPQTLEKGHANM